MSSNLPLVRQSSSVVRGGGGGLNKGGVILSEYGNNCFWFIVQLAFLLK